MFPVTMFKIKINIKTVNFTNKIVNIFLKLNYILIKKSGSFLLLIHYIYPI